MINKLNNLLRRIKRAIRRLQPDIVTVMCPGCNDMIDAYDIYHTCRKGQS